VYRTERTIQTPESMVIRHLDEKGNIKKEDTLDKITSMIAKDEKGNVTAYIAKNIDRVKIRPGEKIVFLDKEGNVESERMLLNVLKKDGEFSTYSESEHAILSGNGEYMMLSYGKGVAQLGAGMEMIGTIEYKYMDRHGNVLWKIQGGRFGFDVTISDDGSRIIIYNPQDDPPHPSGLGRGLHVFDKNGMKLFSCLLGREAEDFHFRDIQLFDSGNYLIVPGDDWSGSKWQPKYLHISVNKGIAFISHDKKKR